jgi:LysR family transcriptional regulator, regulator of abg operon
MKLHQLRDVIAIADLGSLRAAARHLNIAQSAITKSVQQLERELDAPLFERHKRGAVLTPAGALFLERARVATGELRRAQDEISQHRGAETGRVTISLSTVPHLALLPPVIRPFTRRYPRVRLTLHEALGFHNAEGLMRSGSVDAYIGIGPTKLSAEYQVEPLFGNQRYVIAPAGHPLARARSLRQLSDANWVVSSAGTAEANFAALFRKNRCKVPERLTFAAGILTQVMLLLNSEILMIGPKQLLEFAPYRGRLVRIPVREKIEAPMMVMVRRAASPLTPAAEHFCDLVRRASVHLATS